MIIYSLNIYKRYLHLFKDYEITIGKKNMKAIFFNFAGSS